MQFNFTNTTEVGAARTRAKKVIIDTTGITYELENRLIMKDGSAKLYDLGKMVAVIDQDVDIDSLDIDTGEIRGTKNLLTILDSMKVKAKFLVNHFEPRDFEVSTEVGTSYTEIKSITIFNEYLKTPNVTFLFNEVLVLSDDKEMRLEKDSFNISLKMDITEVNAVMTLLELNQDIFDIMVYKSSNLTEEDLTWLI